MGHNIDAMTIKNGQENYVQLSTLSNALQHACTTSLKVMAMLLKCLNKSSLIEV